jgi:hypothetical protein
MSCSFVEFAEEKWESVCHFIPKISSSVAHTVAAPNFWCDKNSYESRGMFSTEMIPSPMAKPWNHFPHKNWARKSQNLHQCVKPKHPRSTAPNSGHYIKNCSSRSCLSLFQHGHPNGWSWSTTTGKSVWQWTISNPHLLMTTPSESLPWACVQACTPLKLSSCWKYRVYYTYITESFLQQPSLHAISTLTSLFCGLMDTNMEPATQAWFKKPTLCSLSHGKEKNTSESLEI